jgi:hypothetical protein
MILRHASAAFFCFAMTALGLGCSSDEQKSGKLCDFLSNGDNCWKTTIKAIDDCLGAGDAGGESSTGTLSADKLTCTYASGKTVIFDAVVDTSVPIDQRKRSFTLKNGAKTCGHVLIDEGDPFVIEMVGPDGKKTAYNANKTTGAMGYSCGDGSTFTGNLLDLGNCGSHFFDQAGLSYIGPMPGKGGDTVYVLGSQSVGYSCGPATP